MHKVLVNHLGGLSLPRKSVVRLSDHPDMTLDVYCGLKTTMQQQSHVSELYYGIRNGKQSRLIRLPRRSSLGLVVHSIVSLIAR